MASSALVVFEVGSSRFALDRDDILQIAPLPRLSRSPAAPEALVGFIKFGVELAAVLRTHVILGIDGPEQPRLYDHIILLRAVDPRTALAVDRVTDVVSVDRVELLKVDSANSHRECVIAEFRSRGAPVFVLDLARVLSAYERDRVRHFHAEETRRRNSFGDAA